MRADINTPSQTQTQPVASESCPVCGQRGLVASVLRTLLPTMQNRVFRERAQALAAKVGRFELRACRACGFAHNAAFDPALLDYDDSYNNSVPSAVMDDYYSRLAARICQPYAEAGGLLVDVGCGNGTFLKTACAMFPRLRGLGIDPSYEGESHLEGGRLQFIQDLFKAAQLQERPALVVCRHVLEHIPKPLEFLQSVSGALAAFADTPVYFEVPDTRWIVEQHAFWYFCYEHCNYFNSEALNTALRRSGFEPGSSGTGFHQQYLWAETRTTAKPVTDDAVTVSDASQNLLAYASAEAGQVSAMKQRLEALSARGTAVAVWGMATKGVIFSFLIDPDHKRIDYCVDVNVKKQGCRVPLTGRLIQAPGVLVTQVQRLLTVVVMNPNYLEEIRGQCAALSLSPSFIDANGVALC